MLIPIGTFNCFRLAFATMILTKNKMFKAGAMIQPVSKINSLKVTGIGRLVCLNRRQITKKRLQITATLDRNNNQRI